MKVKVLNPCWHCYAGAIGECSLMPNCAYAKIAGYQCFCPDLEFEDEIEIEVEETNENT